ncbi:MAG: hypothetical protein JRH06_01665 [Deltaproteobacteria bacterium]|nr:hypothetical protein [Deltaproteobacteria bacterium]MBW2136249.1 hypothetical protein [Deltaproteobacteria bacterium]
MIETDPLPLKSLALWITIICSAIVSAYIIFVSAASIWVGVSHLSEEGAWAPILAGSLAIFLTSLLSFVLVRYLLRKIKQKDIIDL